MSLDWLLVDVCEKVNAPKVGLKKAKEILDNEESDALDRLNALEEKYAKDPDEHLKRLINITNQRIAKLKSDKNWEIELFNYARKYDCKSCPVRKSLSDEFFCGSCDFHASYISNMEDVLGGLALDAYTIETPEDMLEYADQLEKARGKLISAGEMPDIREMTAGIDLTGPKGRSYVLNEAVSWLRHWAGLGISVDPWY